jgi:ubiquinone/menaquinone biosynthesis C-methylase UbiE
MRLIQSIFRPIYYLLYHQFAWGYDFVAKLVSLGRWQGWVYSVVPFLNGRVLEIGFGPGHLQRTLTEKGFLIFGLDESVQMANHASRRLRKQGVASRLVRSYAQYLPFSSGFDSVVATFPSEYIYDPRTLKEIWRVLNPGGTLIILSTAWITGTRPLERLTAWLFRISGEAPGQAGQISTTITDRLSQIGFVISNEIVKLRGSQALVIMAKKD